MTSAGLTGRGGGSLQSAFTLVLDSMGSLGPGAALEARMRREARRSRSLLQNAHLSLAEYRTNTKDQEQEHKVNTGNMF